MHGLRTFFYKTVFITALSFSLVSCSSMNFFSSSAGDLEDGKPENERLAELESEVLELKQNQADLKFMMEKKETTIEKLEKKVLAMRKKISIMEKNKPGKKPVQYKVKYTSPATLYKKARNLLIEEDYVNASSLFSTFLKNHPQDSLADNALYWLGECYYTQSDYKKAITTFKDLESKYPKSEKVPDAILKQGYSYLSLDDTNRAHHYLKKVIKTYPFSPAAEKAQEKLRSFE